MLFLIPPIELPVESQTIVREWSPPASRLYVRFYVRELGWNDKEWRCLDELVNRESRWDMRADNPKSSAFGLFQVLKTKEDSTLQDQVKAGLGYIDHRYEGSSCKALAHHNRKNWY
jgi:hypothetical protein